MKAAGNPVTNLDPRNPFAERFDLAGTVGQRHHADLRRTATAAFQNHQIPVVQRACAHPHQDFLPPGPRAFARSELDSVDAAEALDVIGLHFLLPDVFSEAGHRTITCRYCPPATVNGAVASSPITACRTGRSGRACAAEPAIRTWLVQYGRRWGDYRRR